MPVCLGVLRENIPDELVPPVLLSNVLQCLELPRRHRASTDVSNPPLLNDIVQRFHDLLSRCAAVETVDLQYVDVRAESLNALLDSVEDVLAAEADLVDHFTIVYGNRRNSERWIFFGDAEIAF